MRGKLITFEGIEGCGKTTQAKYLFRWLLDLKVPAVLGKDPGTTEPGEKLRELLLNNSYRLSEKSEVLLYLAARNLLVEEIILPSLSQGKVVILDRFSDSFIAYQGYGRGIDINWLKQLNEWATGGISPDLTIVLDVPVEVGFKRIKKVCGEAFDRIEMEDEEFHRRVRKGFLSIAKEEPQRVKVVDGRKSEQEVFEEIKKLVLSIINVQA